MILRKGKDCSYGQRRNPLACEKNKQSSRERVIQFILTNHPQERLHYLGMPGLEWKVEKTLLGHIPKASFIGLEWREDAFVQEMQTMPGNYLGKTALFAGLKRIEGAYSDKAELWHINAATFLQVDLSYMIDHPREKRITAAWLDFTSPYGIEVVGACRGLASLPLIYDKLPFVVTISLGRELVEDMAHLNALVMAGSAAERRFQAIKLAMEVQAPDRKVEINEIWTYHTASSYYTIANMSGNVSRR